jgi:hypothetical protein
MLILYINIFRPNIIDLHLIFYYIGISIIFLSHITMAMNPGPMRIHAYVNLFAATCIAYYFMNKEGFIHF